MKNKNARKFVLGLIAGSVALLVAAAFRIVAEELFLPELASQMLFSLTPGQVESFSVETFGSLANSPNIGSRSPIAAIAFAGDRGISKVEVSTEGGNTWQSVSIKDLLSSNSWVLWAPNWIP